MPRRSAVSIATFGASTCTVITSTPWSARLLVASASLTGSDHSPVKITCVLMLGSTERAPSITTQVIFTGECSLPVKEAEATNSLADQGVDVITVHVDAPKVAMETAERRGIFCCGYHANQQKLAPKGYLTGAEWNWEKVYRMFVEKAQKGEPLPNFVRGGLADGFVKMSAYGPAVPEAARKQADAVKAEIMKGGYAVFKGPLKDNRGKDVVAGGKAYVETAIELESMDYLVAGVVGSTA